MQLSPLWERCDPSFEGKKKFEFPSSKYYYCQIWLKLDQWYWKEYFLKFSMDLYYFKIISPLRRAWPFIWTNFNLLHPKCFVPSFVEIGPVVLEKKIFKSCQFIFIISKIISPLGRAWPFIWPNLNSLYPGLLCAKFGWN